MLHQEHVPTEFNDSIMLLRYRHLNTLNIGRHHLSYWLHIQSRIRPTLVYS